MMRIIIVVLLIVSRDYHPFRTAVDWDRATLVLHRIPFCTKSTPEIRLIVQSLEVALHEGSRLHDE